MNYQEYFLSFSLTCSRSIERLVEICLHITDRTSCCPISMIWVSNEYSQCQENDFKNFNVKMLQIILRQMNPWK